MGGVKCFFEKRQSQWIASDIYFTGIFEKITIPINNFVMPITKVGQRGSCLIGFFSQ